jgi:hypothetical protein
MQQTVKVVPGDVDGRSAERTHEASLMRWDRCESEPVYFLRYMKLRTNKIGGWLFPGHRINPIVRIAVFFLVRK